MGKKVRIEDCIYRDEDTGILYVILRDEFGRAVWKSTRGKKKTTARDLRDKLKEERRLRKLDLKMSRKEEERRRLTLADLLERYRPTYESKKSARDDKRYAKFWKRTLGRERVQDITPTDIKDTRRDKLLTGVSHATVNRHTSFLRRMFNLAIGDSIIDSNPCSGLRVPPLQEGGPRERVISPSEERAICKHLEPLFRATLLVSLYSGLRMTEAASLRRTDIDLERGCFLLEETKSGKRQEAPMSPVAKEAVLYAMGAHEHEYLFPSPSKDGAHISRRSLHDRLIKAVRAAGIEVKPANQDGITWHATRHTFITRLTESGANIGTVNELARHSTINMTNDYIHTSSEINREALRALCDGVDSSIFFEV